MTLRPSARLSVAHDPKRSLGDLETILAVTRAMTAEHDLDRLLDLIIQSATSLVRADRSSLFIVDHQAKELWTRIAQGSQTIRLPIGSGIAGLVAGTGEAVNIVDAYNDPRFNADNDRRSGYRTRSILTTPLINQQGQVVGVIQALNKQILGGDVGAFDSYDVQLLASLGSQAAVAIDTARLIASDREREKMAQELQVAQRIQLSLLPKSMPTFAGWAFGAWQASCDQTGGDYHDFIPAGGTDGGLDVVVGDVSGHGIGAALLMSSARASLRALHRSPLPAEHLIAQLNSLLALDMGDDTFMTMVLCRLYADGSAKYVSAGHEPPLIWRAATQTFDTPGDTGLLLGAMPEMDYEAHGIPPLRRGDALVAYTDGFPESVIPGTNTDFGVDGLRRAAARALMAGAGGDLTTLPAAVCAAAVADLIAHTNGAPAADDRTIVCAVRTA